MKPVRPVYLRLLIAAVILWIISTTYCLADLYGRVCAMDHALSHTSPAHSGHHEER